MPGPPSDSATKAWTALLRAHTAALGAVERRLKDAGLPPLSWYDVLLELERAGDGGLRPFELERALLLPQYGLSRLLTRIAGAGHVERRPCAADGRGHVLLITASGRALRRRMWPAYGAAIEDAVGRYLSDREAESLAAMLGKLCAS